MMILHYLKFFLFHFIGLLSVVSLLAGGGWITLGLIVILVGYMAGDALLGDDISIPRYQAPQLLTFQLWMALPLTSLIMFSLVWSVSSHDLLGFGQWLSALGGYDLLAAREATAWPHHISAVIMGGLMIGLVATIPAHELTHRTWDPVSMLIGRWLLAFSFDTAFSIEHVYGHHRYVSTTEDPATAPRGRNVYAHIVISTIRGNISAWTLETSRLQRSKKNIFSLHNRSIRGYLMSIFLVAVVYWLAGLEPTIYFIATGLFGKALLEIVNYMEHYGIVRNSKTPVAPRHSWNTNRRVSSWAMFNLTRHSHHHAQGEVPYHELKPYNDAPEMINGYLTTIIITLIPPLWHKLMLPKLKEWDEKYATAEEKILIEQANQKSGLSGLLSQS